MKLHSRKPKYLSFILIFASLTVLAFSVFNVSWPFHNIPGSGSKGEAFADTLLKHNPPAPDTAFANCLHRADGFLKANKPEECLAELEKAQKLRPTDKSVNARIAQVRGSISGSQKKQSDFRNSIASGDAAFQKKDYLNAKAYYQLALNLIPADSAARDKLKKTMDLIRSQKAQNTLYDVAVSSADRLFQEGEYDKANEEYENASRILPSEQYPKQKINEIVKIKVDQQLQAGEYAVAIKNADQYYNAKNWQPALLEYQNASKIRPQEKYPKDRIAELTLLVADQRSKDEAYSKLIANADELFSNKSYVASRKNYMNASKIKPEQSYPKNKIIEIDKLLASLGKIQKDYEQYVSLADSFYIDKNFIRARDYYTLAIGAKPGENYPKEMLEKVKPLVAGQEANEKSREESYQSAIAIADKEFTDKNFDQARKEYLRASDIKPAEAYPKGRIQAIDKLFADQQQAALLSATEKQKALDNEYKAAIASGEKLFKARTWDQAKSEYQKALALKPDEILPKKRITSIDSIGNAGIARAKKLDDDYNLAVRKGDSLLGATLYAQAKTAFTEATRLKPAEAYPKEKLAVINTTLADLAKQQALDKQYLAAINAADKLFAAKSYTEAKVQYTSALNFKPGEAYPGTKIAEISRLLEESAKQRAVDGEYAGIIASGEKLFKAKSWDQAKSEYQKALVLKPDEILPKKRITSIDSIAELFEKQKSLDEQYAGLIGNADKLLAAKTYEQAKSEYGKALAIKPAETYPKTKIQEIDKQLAEIARAKKMDDDYKLAVKKGDSLLGITLYAQAKVVFTEAAGLKPEEAYPKEKLAVINTALANLARQMALDKQYLEAISSADKLLSAKSFEEAKTQYTAALALKPGEAYPTSKISDIDKTLAEIARQKARDDQYNALMASGEKLFISKSLSEAKSEYQKALVLKPDEILPKKRITSIDSIAELFEKQKSLDEQYAGLIGNADKLLAAKTYEQAKSEYGKALAIKPAETYPKTKIQEIDKQLAEIARAKKMDDDYKLAVKKGDSLLGITLYTQAKTAFAEAATLKPSEAYPKTKLVQIDKALEDLAKQKELDRQYLAAMTSADKFLEGKSYGEAKAQYTAALALKPGEAYPTSKISDIDKTLAEIARQKARDDQYNAILASGEKLFNAKSLSEAKAEYQKALAVKPGEMLPKSRIYSIDSINNSIIAARKARDSAYTALTANADKLFAAHSYEEAKADYQKALIIKADDLYAKTKIGEADKALADVSRQKALIESNYKASIAKADQLLASKSYEPAKAEYTKALSIKQGEQYPQDKIKEINNILAELKAKEEAYKASLAKADQMLLEKKYEDARTEYENAMTIQPNEQYPKSKVDEINKKLADIQGRKKTFDDLVQNGDNAFGSKDYGKAREYLQQAINLFPEDKYARDRLGRVTSVIDSIYRANRGKYDKAIAEADKFYNGFEFDKAIDAYSDASALLPMENYPREMIARIHRTIAENAIADVLNSAVTVASNEEKQFKFSPVNIAARKDNFIYIKLRNLSNKPFNVLLRYGKDKTPSGGVVIRNLSTDGKVNERLISVREQDVWYRIDNDFISLYPQGGDIEVTFIQVSKAR